MNVVTQPYARPRPHKPDNFATTMAQPYDLPAKVAEENAQDVVDLTAYMEAHPDGKAHLWALASNSVGPRIWAKMKKGDLVLFYGNSYVYAYGFIASRTMWPNNDHIWPVHAPGPANWDYLYSLDGVTLLDEPDHIHTGLLKREALQRFSAMQTGYHLIEGDELPPLLEEMLAGGQIERRGRRAVVQGATDPRVTRVVVRARVLAAVGTEVPRQARDDVVLQVVARHLELGVPDPSLGRLFAAILDALDEPAPTPDDFGPEDNRLGEPGWTKVLRGLTNLPRSFILNQADHPDSARYEDIEGTEYGFDNTVSARLPFLGGGAGSRVVFYRTINASEPPRRAFVAHAAVGHITEPEPGTYRARLHDYQAFPVPVFADDVAIRDWNVQNGIVEITFATLQAIIAAGHSTLDEGVSSESMESISDAAAKARLDAAPAADAPIDLTGKADPVPDLTTAAPEPSEEIVASWNDDSFDPITRPMKRRSKNQTSLDRLAEKRAVHVVKTYLSSLGWDLVKDQQTAGVGYDLLYKIDGEERHVEVKGIQGGGLVFNVTAKEWQRILEDQHFLLLAVTDVLNDNKLHIRAMSRDVLAGARRAPVGYRLSVQPSTP